MITWDEDFLSFRLKEAAKFRHYSLDALKLVYEYKS